MSEFIWQLPVKESNITDLSWIHHKAKYHAFINNKSLCGSKYQITGFYDNTIEESELMQKKEIACKKCIKLAMSQSN